MEAKSIQEITKSSKVVSSLENFRPEHAGTPEEEQEIGANAAIAAIQSFRTKRYEKAYWDNINKPIVYPKYTAAELYDYVVNVVSKEIYPPTKEYPDGMVIDPYNEKIIRALCLYFTDDIEFEKQGYGSLEKGLMLFGNIGCGKTSIMRLFSSNQKQSFAVKSCQEITDGYFRALNSKTQDPEINLERHYKAIVTGEPKKFFGQLSIGCCFDDLGTDEEKKHFGNNINVMGEIMMARYNRIHELKKMTHLTTNLSADEIEKHYGSRVRSRIREMFNAIPFDSKAPDRRK